MKIILSAQYQDDTKEWRSVSKSFHFQALPRVDEFLNIGDLNMQYRVREVVHDTDGTVTVGFRIPVLRELEVLVHKGWDI